MTTLQIKWSQKEFLAYLLIFAAHADNNFTTEEEKHILSIIDPWSYTKALAEFSKDNGFVQIQKIMKYQKANASFSIDLILHEMESLFYSDNYYHRMEKFTLASIRRLLSEYPIKY